MYGYAGKMLDVDLTSGKIKELPVGEGLARDYLGGLGFNARLLYEEIPSGADPLGPENVLVFCAGALLRPFSSGARLAFRNAHVFWLPPECQIFAGSA